MSTCRIETLKYVLEEFLTILVPWTPPLGLVKPTEPFSEKGIEKMHKINLTFIGPCVANIFAEYNQQDATFHNLFISVRRSARFRRFFHP